MVGLGGMGSATLYHLAQRGLSVLGIDPYGIAHDRGSSHGQSRIIRKAYFENAAYVPLVERSYKLWDALESASGERLYDRTGLLVIGPSGGDVIQGVKKAAAQHHLPIHPISEADQDQSQAHTLGLFHHLEGLQVLWEKEAGILHVEKCVRAHIEQAQRRGAQVLLDQKVTQWRSTAQGVMVSTTSQEFEADKLVVCAGPWTRSILGDQGFPIQVRRKVQMWFAAPKDRFSIDQGFPAFCFSTPDEFFYGFPIIQDGLMKVAEHIDTEIVDDPDKIDRTLRKEDQAPVIEFLRRHLPDVNPTVVSHSVCMYSMTPDEHFIVDHLPSSDHVIVAAGFSGHGFKFAPVIGSAIADLVEHGQTKIPLDLFSAKRPSLVRS